MIKNTKSKLISKVSNLSDPYMKRLRAEFKRMKIEFPPNESQINWKIINRDLHFYEIIFPGPKNSPYENGEYVVSIELPGQYPQVPPIANFITPIFHPNIAANFPKMKVGDQPVYDWGSNICLSLINPKTINKSGGWNSEIYLYTVVEHLYMMLEVFQSKNIDEFPEYLVNPKSPFNPEAGFKLLEGFNEFEKIAKKWNKKYAIPKKD